MRLIDADVLEPHEQMEPMGNGNYEYVEVVYKDDIDNAPTIDAVPVVRCKDCVYLYHARGYGQECTRYAERSYVTNDNFFCSEGKRLKPCAKCGGEPQLFYNDIDTPGIRCKKCGHWIRQRFWDREQVIELWNTLDREDGEE